MNSFPFIYCSDWSNSGSCKICRIWIGLWFDSLCWITEWLERNFHGRICLNVEKNYFDVFGLVCDSMGLFMLEFGRISDWLQREFSVSSLVVYWLGIEFSGLVDCRRNMFCRVRIRIWFDGYILVGGWIHTYFIHNFEVRIRLHVDENYFIAFVMGSDSLKFFGLVRVGFRIDFKRNF